MLTVMCFMGLCEHQHGPGSKHYCFLQHSCWWRGWTHSGFLDIGVGHNFQPHFLQEIKELMHQKLVLSSLLSTLCLLVPSHSGDLAVLWLGKAFSCFIEKGIIQILSNGQTRFSELIHLAWVRQIYSFSNTWSFRYYAFSACRVQLLMLWRLSILCEIQLKQPIILGILNHTTKVQ